MDQLIATQHLKRLTFLGPAAHQLVSRYLRLLEARNYAEGTLAAAVNALQRFYRLLPPERQAVIAADLTQTTPADVGQFVAAAGRRGLQPATINQTLSLLSELFEYLREERLTQVQPVIRRRHRVLAPRPVPKPIPEPDLTRFFQAVDSTRDRLLFLLMLRCGLRVSEVCDLTWSLVDWAGGSCRVNNGKGQVDRVVYLSPDVVQALSAWRALDPPQPYLFPSPSRSGPLCTRHVARLMRRYLRQAGLERPYSPHRLRHTFATQLLNEGIALEVLKELLGHRSVQQTLQYAQLHEPTRRQQYEQAMARVERRLRAGR